MNIIFLFQEIETNSKLSELVLDVVRHVINVTLTVIIGHR